MRNVKRLLMAAAVAASALLGGAPQLAAAEVTAVATAVAAVPDGTYWLKDDQGNIVGYIIVRNGQVVGGEVWAAQ